MVSAATSLDHQRLLARKGNERLAHFHCFLRVQLSQRVAKTTDGASVELGHARLIHADFCANLLHRDFAVVVETDQLALAPRQQPDGAAHPLANLGLLVDGVGGVRCCRCEHRGERAFCESLAGRQRRGRFDGVDSDDRAVEPLLVVANFGREIGERRFVPQLATQGLARRVELAALAAHATRPRVPPQCVDHRAADSAFRERLELDATLFVEAVRRVDQPKDPVLHEISDIDRIRHRRRHPPSQGLNEGKTGDDSAVLMSGDGLGTHRLSSPLTSDHPVRFGRNRSVVPMDAHHRNRCTTAMKTMPMRRAAELEPDLVNDCATIQLVRWKTTVNGMRTRVRGRPYSSNRDKT